jgi:apoptosis-inducing factor 3
LITPNQQPDSEGFYQVAAVSEVREGGITAVTIHDTSIILTRINDAIYAFSALCPHASGDLRQGELHRGRIDCPDHGYRFDIRTGHPVWPPDEVCRLKKFSLKQINDQILVKL